MKSLLKTIFFSIIFVTLTTSLLAHCPKKAFRAHFMSYDPDDKSMVVKTEKSEKEKLVRISKKTLLFNMESISEIKKFEIIIISGCNCEQKFASRIAFPKDRKK